MSVHKGKRSAKVKVPKGVDPLKIIHLHAAGIDAHSAEHFVCVSEDAPPKDVANPDPNLPLHVRRFGTTTGELKALVQWLRDCGVTSAAVESTGVYHLPLVDLLEQAGIEIVIADPRQTASAPGRPKTDVVDCQWIWRLHAYGLLRASFRPSAKIRELREYERLRDTLLRSAASEVQRTQKALDQMNCKLTVVVTDIVGSTGWNIIKSILRGCRDPWQLSKYRDPHCKASQQQIAAALEANWSEEHLFALRMAVKMYEECQRRLKECATRIADCLRGFADKAANKELPPDPRKKGKAKNEVPFDVRRLLFDKLGVDATQIEGIDATTALVLVSELGFDLSAFADERHFSSWLRLSPNHRGSAGKIQRRNRSPGSSRAARAFRMAAQGCHHAKNAMGAFYRRIAARRGGAKALVATARKIAERFYRLLSQRTAGDRYVRKDMNECEASYRLKLVRGLATKARELGYQLTPAPLAVQ
jgi:transposase